MVIRTNHYDLRVSPILAAILMSLLLLWSTLPAQAQSGTTITANTAEDESNSDGDCSLREAVEAADANVAVGGCRAGSASGEDRIAFKVGKEATIKLDPQLGQINVTDTGGLSIDGGKKDVTVSGGDQTRVFEVSSGAELTIQDLTVADGSTSDEGGGISNFGTLEVSNSTFSQNSADSSSAGIGNRGTLTVTNSTFSNNNTSGFGGSIGNRGTSTVTNSTFSKNSADAGGGIVNCGSCALEVTNSTFSRNSAAEDPNGGGILNFGTLEVTNSTFSENSTGGGGGGAIRNFEAFGSRGTTMLRNTILAYSSQGGNCSGTITDGGYNTSSDFCAFTDPTSKNNTDPLLSPKGLKNRGGPTKTIGIRPDSPALNAIPEGENGCGTDIKTDQRGVLRPQDNGCDIGAFEENRRR